MVPELRSQTKLFVLDMILRNQLPAISILIRGYDGTSVDWKQLFGKRVKLSCTMAESRHFKI